jgi:uncharacterized iron-regulated membrane protein
MMEAYMLALVAAGLLMIVSGVMLQATRRRAMVPVPARARRRK